MQHVLRLHPFLIRREVLVAPEAMVTLTNMGLGKVTPKKGRYQFAGYRPLFETNPDGRIR